MKVSPEELLSGTESVHDKGRRQNYYIVDKTSEIGILIQEYNSMNLAQKERLMGYVQALKDIERK